MSIKWVSINFIVWHRVKLIKVGSLLFSFTLCIRDWVTKHKGVVVSPYILLIYIASNNSSSSFSDKLCFSFLNNINNQDRKYYLFHLSLLRIQGSLLFILKSNGCALSSIGVRRREGKIIETEIKLKHSTCN